MPPPIFFFNWGGGGVKKVQIKKPEHPCKMHECSGMVKFKNPCDNFSDTSNFFFQFCWRWCQKNPSIDQYKRFLCTPPPPKEWCLRLHKNASASIKILTKILDKDFWQRFLTKIFDKDFWQRFLTKIWHHLQFFLMPPPTFFFKCWRWCQKNSNKKSQSTRAKCTSALAWSNSEIFSNQMSKTGVAGLSQLWVKNWTWSIQKYFPPKCHTRE